MNKTIKHKIPFTLLLICALIILIFSLFISAPKIADINSLDKFEHIAAYIALSLLFVLSFKNRNKVIIISIIICTMYGGLMEVLQGITGRNPGFIDLLADLIGSIIGSMAGYFVKPVLLKIK